ncbi:MAG: hypothetical protein ACXVCA_07385, partial [Bdellovibrio sp.]
MRNSKQLLKVILMVCSVALLSACGSNKNAGSSDFSSRAPITTTTSSTKPIATCSKGSGNM